MTAYGLVLHEGPTRANSALAIVPPKLLKRARIARLDLWLHADAPPPERQANGLPVKRAAALLLNAHLHWPKPEALGGRRHMPAVQRVD